MANEHRESHKLTSSEAQEMIKRAPTGASFHIHIRTDLPVVDNDEQHFPGAGRSRVSVSRKEAARIVGELLSERMEARGARIRISINSWKLLDKTRITYWIG